jgi:hypothetical protein
VPKCRTQLSATAHRLPACGSRGFAMASSPVVTAVGGTLFVPHTIMLPWNSIRHRSRVRRCFAPDDVSEPRSSPGTPGAQARIDSGRTSKSLILSPVSGPFGFARTNSARFTSRSPHSISRAKESIDWPRKPDRAPYLCLLCPAGYHAALGATPGRGVALRAVRRVAWRPQTSAAALEPHRRPDVSPKRRIVC